MDVTQKMNELIDFLNKATEAYDNGSPFLTDPDWDDAYFELKDLEESSGIVLPNSPTQTIIFETKFALTKIKHEHPMLSLAKTKDIKKVQEFLSNVPLLPIAMPKLDGLICSITYEKGRLVRAETRGNGRIGEDILHNILVNPTVPKNIPYFNRLVLDGEVICTYKNFEKFSSEYKNPRNFAAGSIRLLNAQESYNRNLTFVVWDVIEPFIDADKTLVNQLKAAKNYGFQVVPFYRPEDTKDNLEVAIETIKDKAKELSYPIDGVVFKFNDISLRETLGATEHHFNNAIAFKFYDELYDTTLRNIEWTMGRTGVLTPVAIFDPVDIDGTTVERASLHNINIMESILGTKPFIGQAIKVSKRNMIIPQVEYAEKNYE